MKGKMACCIMVLFAVLNLPTTSPARRLFGDPVTCDDGGDVRTVFKADLDNNTNVAVTEDTLWLLSDTTATCYNTSEPEINSSFQPGPSGEAYEWTFLGYVEGPGWGKPLTEPEIGTWSLTPVNYPGVNWIWPRPGVSYEHAFFRHAFVLPESLVVNGSILEITGDNEYIVYLNGKELGRDGDCQEPYEGELWRTAETYYPDSSLFSFGSNVLAVHGYNNYLVTGVRYRLSIAVASPPYQLSIAGSVGYCHTGGPVVNVTMTLSGGASDVTDSNGTYLLENLTGGLNYTVTPSRPDEGCPFFPIIIMYDAALTAQHVVMMIDLDSCGQWAADVDENGIIQMYDAALIAQCAVGIPNPECHAGEWRFDPESRSYTPLDSDQMNEDYSAILLGDVDGNWPRAAAGPGKQLATQSYQDLPDMEAGVEEVIEIPLVMEQADGVISADIVFSYDAEVLEFVGISKTALSESFQLVSNDEPGKLRAGLYGTTPITQPGELVVLAFKVIGEEGQTSRLCLERYQLNAGPVKSAEAKLTVVARVPKEYALSQNYPNPFNPNTLIRYAIPDRDREGRPYHTTLKIYNVAGQLVRTLVDGQRKAGWYVVTWDGCDGFGKSVSSGIYFYRLKAGEFTQTRRMILIK